MEPILRSYKNIIALVIAFSTWLQWTALKYGLPILDQLLATASQEKATAIKTGIFIISSTTLYTSICKLAFWCFEKYGWKLIHPELDFEGEWKTEYRYDFYPDDVVNIGKPAQHVHPGTAVIYQAWDGSISVTGTFIGEDKHGKSTAEWRSVSFAVEPGRNKTASIFMTYLSLRTGQSEFLKGGEQVKGVEELNVILDSKKGYPIALRGTFYNYVQNPKRLSGHALWTRVTRKGRKLR